MIITAMTNDATNVSLFLMLNIVQSKGHDLIRDAIRTKKRKWGAGGPLPDPRDTWVR